ncbi:MAG TPA: excinuclease ABC subunit UvrC [Bacillota bacterium]|nr:excinuclease ABC subunit UvrC [Clostridiales bacterium]HPT85592.1 excinuclease ABC subunit UvrC [Bacillota bacterium]
MRNFSPNIEHLREKAAALPATPGVYLMRDKNGKVIYVGKSKALRQRVSQYFHEHASHDIKTAKMVASVWDFDYMLTDNHMEALTLENQLIKLHKPKYNIKLKDDKNYPYIKITLSEEYPRIQIVRRRAADDAKYFGPYSSYGAAFELADTLQKTFRIPTCKRVFPRDIGKGRPCLNYQLGRCDAVCMGKVSPEEYRKRFSDIMAFLRGSFDEVKKSLTKQMENAAEELRFEAAAVYRDRIATLERVWQKQKVVGAPDVEQDVIALYTSELCSCITIFYIRNGSVVDSDSFCFPPDQLCDGDTITAFLSDLYQKREYIPREILFGFRLGEENESVFAEFCSERAGYKVRLRFPERGDARALCDMVYDNAKQRAEAYIAEAERDNRTLVKLASLLGLEVVPERIEAFDISNYGSESMTAGMVVTEGVKFKKSEYRTYKIQSVTGAPDDYAAMAEAVRRRLEHNTGELPDLILLDGGKGHVSTIKGLLAELGYDIPVFGMVKDEYHKTRALTTESEEISIAREHAVFTFIYKLQEEVHRYTVTRMKQSKSRLLKRSSLEDIPGIGPAKAKALITAFGSIAAVRAADVESLAKVKLISQADAERIYSHFHKNENG